MADNGAELRSIAWSQAFPFLRLFQTLRLALDFKRLMLALGAVMLTYLGGVILDGHHFPFIGVCFICHF